MVCEYEERLTYSRTLALLIMMHRMVLWNARWLKMWRKDYAVVYCLVDHRSEVGVWWRSGSSEVGKMPQCLCGEISPSEGSTVHHVGFRMWALVCAYVNAQPIWWCSAHMVMLSPYGDGVRSVAVLLLVMFSAGWLLGHVSKSMTWWMWVNYERIYECWWT